MDSKAIRQQFFKYFIKHGHAHVPSASLVPADDPTLLFTNAGMVPFKDYFLGQKSPPWPTAVSAQRCVRAGGKHNDLDNVGKTARHHTFFEMLGFFSFGEYFKEKAIQLAWGFLTESLQIDPDKLWITVHTSDQEAFDIWHKTIGVAKERIVYCGDEDNFWAMGDSGPCGPCTEIFYDHGPGVAGGPPGSPDADGDRYVEIWNLVFMQYDRQDGKLKALPKPAVDTGMGLERIAAVLQGVSDNYDTDIFQALQKAIEKAYPDQIIEPLVKRVLADHLRAMVFLLADGVLPSNEGRGYVLRRIMRRAMCFAHRGKLALPCLHQWVGDVYALMQDVFPGDEDCLVGIKEHIKQEEVRFAEVLASGLQALDGLLAQNKRIAGEDAFRLYDTYGLPLEVAIDWADMHEGSIDEAGFSACMAAQKAQSKQHQSFLMSAQLDVADLSSTFVGHQCFEAKGSVIGLLKNDVRTQSLQAGEKGVVILDQTALYPEGGGQVGDRGKILASGIEFVVEDTQKIGDAIVHFGVCQTGRLQVGDEVTSKVSPERLQTAVHHTATHLLHAALRDCLGKTVSQRGSYVSKDRLRFDFAYGKALSASDFVALEDWVGGAIRANIALESTWMDLEEAKAQGAMALFDEKYEQKVRVLKIGDVSTELCGGTHVTRTGDIGAFVIVSSASVAAGVRRIEALAGQAADKWLQGQRSVLQALSEQLQCPQEQLLAKAEQLQKNVKQLQKQANMQGQAGLKETVNSWCSSATKVGDVSLIAQVIDEKYSKQLRDIADVLRGQSGAWAAVLVVQGKAEHARVPFLCAASKDCKWDAKALMAPLASLGAKGGGRPDFIQGALEWSGKANEVLACIQDHLD